MEFRNNSRVWAFLLCLLASVLARAHGIDPALPPLEFHIQGGDATDTLTEFSRQARLQLLFDFNVVKGHLTKPLDGMFKPVEALRTHRPTPISTSTSSTITPWRSCAKSPTW